MTPSASWPVFGSAKSGKAASQPMIRPSGVRRSASIWRPGICIVVESTMQIPGRQIDALLRTPDGRIIGWDAAFPDFADPNTGQLADGVIEMTRVVPIEIYPQVAARYALLHVLLG